MLAKLRFGNAKNSKEIMMILEHVKNKPEDIDFKEVIAYIDEHYDFTPTKFKNGNTINEANENNGSCKVFSFAKLNDLSKKGTLSLCLECDLLRLYF